jgi:hypothetical protein
MRLSDLGCYGGHNDPDTIDARRALYRGCCVLQRDLSMDRSWMKISSVLRVKFCVGNAHFEKRFASRKCF